MTEIALDGEPPAFGPGAETPEERKKRREKFSADLDKLVAEAEELRKEREADGE